MPHALTPPAPADPRARRRTRLPVALLLGAVAASLSPLAHAQTAPTIHVAFLWHMHQPHYYPGETIRQSDAAGRYSYRIEDIFNQRTGPYTSWPRNAIKMGQDAGLPHAGASVSFTGSLVEGLDHLEASGNGNFRGWKAPWREAAAWRTAQGNARLDLIGFGYYHPLMPLIGSDAIARQVVQHRALVTSTFGAPASKGIFTPENAFATRIVPGLRAAGVEWAMVDNIHMERAAADYPYSSGGNLVEPNRADVRNANPADWRQLTGLWAPTQVSAWARRPHYVEHVDPETGVAQRIVAVPTDRYLGNEDGRGGFGALQYEAVMRQFEADNTDPDHPILLVLHHDGDNYGGGSEAYYNGNFRSFVDWVKANPSRFTFTTVQDYLDRFPPDPSDVIHVESGSWAGADNGDPEFLKWLGRPGPDGASPDRNSWAVLTAASNHVATAGASVSPDALRWLDTGMASDYWYWDGTEIWDSQVTRASNEAVRLAAASSATDAAPPTVFVPQRTPYNPGEAEWGQIQTRDLTVWTYAYDVSGLTSVTLRYRVDADGRVDRDNRTFAGHASPWQTLPMASVVEPAARTTPAPTVRAARYEATLRGLSGVLVDYVVEAVDANGARTVSDVQHVWIGTGAPGGGGGATGGRMTWTPTAPTPDQTVQIRIAAPGTATAVLHWGVNAQGTTWATPIAAYRPGGTTLFGGTGPAVESPFTRDGDTLRLTLGPFNNAAQTVRSIDFAVRYGDGTWDNGGGQDHHIALSGSTGGEGGGAGFTLDGALDASARVVARSGSRTLHAGYSGGRLYLATEGAGSTGDVFVMLAEAPGAAMSAMWGKAGTVATPAAFLARESTNGWTGWFAPPSSTPVTGAAYGVASGAVLEGTVDVAAVFGRVPEAVYVAVAEYATADGGALSAQVPSGNADGALDASEFVRVPLMAATDADAPTVADAFALGAPHPNPVAGAGRLPLRVAAAGRVTVAAYDVLGRRVAVLADTDLAPGDHLVPVEAGVLAPGVYVVRATQGADVRTVRLVVR